MARCALVVALAACAEGANLTLPGGASGGSDSGEDGAGGASSDSGADEANAGGASGSDSGGGGQGGSATGGSSQDGSATGGSEAAASDTGGPTADAAGNSDASGDGAVADAARDSGPGDAARGDGAVRDAPTVDARADALADAAPGTVGLEAYYPLDEGAGTLASDATGHNHTAAVTGGWATGRVGTSALLLNGTTDSAQIPGAVVNTTRPYSVAAWVQLTQVNGFRTAIAIEGVNVSAFFLQYRSDVVGFAFAALPSDNPVAATIATAGVTPLANTWYHIAGVYDGAMIKFYLNGVLRQMVPYTAAWLGTGNTVIGRSRYGGGPTDFWPGLIDEVRIYSRALTDAEVAALAVP